MNQILIAIVGLCLTGVIGMFVLSFTASRPTNLGVNSEGRLADVPSSPNCVSTQTADQSHWIAPLEFSGPPNDALARLLEVIANMPGSKVISRDKHYVYVEFTSTFFRFVDYVEFLMEPETNQIHFRSASRVGHSDLGANRKRMETIRTAFQASSSKTDNFGEQAAPSETL